jgi:hypothetical protein
LRSGTAGIYLPSEFSGELAQACEIVAWLEVRWRHEWSARSYDDV